MPPYVSSLGPRARSDPASLPSVLPAPKIKDFMKSCYLNIALNCQKMNEHDIAIKACDEVIDEIDSYNAKALYRRAMSRIAPKSSGGLEQDLAMKDLMLASDHHPSDRTIAKQLKILKEQAKIQKKTDKRTFNGMFGRGEVYTDADEVRIRDDLERARVETLKKKVRGRLLYLSKIINYCVRSRSLTCAVCSIPPGPWRR